MQEKDQDQDHFQSASDVDEDDPEFPDPENPHPGVIMPQNNQVYLGDESAMESTMDHKLAAKPEVTPRSNKHSHPRKAHKRKLTPAATTAASKKRPSKVTPRNTPTRKKRSSAKKKTLSQEEKVTRYTRGELKTKFGRLSSIQRQHEDVEYILDEFLGSGIDPPIRLWWRQGIKRKSSRATYLEQLSFMMLLSSKSSDHQVRKVGLELVNREEFSIAWVDSISIEELTKIIYSAGRQNQNAINMKLIARELVNDHDGHLPENFQFLQGLPGCGNKTAGIACKDALGNVVVRLACSLVFNFCNCYL